MVVQEINIIGMINLVWCQEKVKIVVIDQKIQISKPSKKVSLNRTKIESQVSYVVGVRVRSLQHLTVDPYNTI